MVAAIRPPSQPALRKATPDREAIARSLQEKRQITVRLSLACALLAGASLLSASEASHAARRARKAEKAGRLSDAYLLYSQASRLKPANRLYRSKVAALEEKAILASETTKAAEAEAAAEKGKEAPAEQEAVKITDVFDPLSSQDAETISRLAPPAELHAKPGKFDLDLQGNARALFEQVSRLYGLDVVFDGDYDGGPPRRFRLEQAGYREALYGLQSATSSIVVPLNSTLFLVAKDDPRKRTDLEQTATVTIPIPQALTAQELIEIGQVVRQVTGVEKLAWDNKTSSLVIRDRVSRVFPAQALVTTLFSYKAQVAVELQLIEIRKSDVLSYGLSLPNTFTAAYKGIEQSVNTIAGLLPSNANNPFPFGSSSYNFIALASQAATNSTEAAFRGLFPNSLSLFSIGLGAANALANFSESIGRTILKTDLRTTDAQAASFHIGDRYPILTGSYSAGTTVQSQYLPAAPFTFENLGLTLKITPHVHGMDEISVDLESEYELLTGQTVNGNPVISSRKLTAVVRLQNDEWGLIAGLVLQNNTRSTSGTVGLSQIPILGHLFEQKNKQNDDSEILILMKPRLLSLPGEQKAMQQIRVGSEARPFLPL